MNSKTISHSSLKPAAINLRREGKSFGEIQLELGPISKSTLSGWLKNVELTELQKSRIKLMATEKGFAGRQMGSWRNHQNRVERLAQLKSIAIKEYPGHLGNPLFVAGLVLYLAEGTRKMERFMFMNSEPGLIKLMVVWITKVIGLDLSVLRFRLYIHELYADENCEGFWIDFLKINPEQMLKTIYKPSSRIYKKNPEYKGCLRIELPGSELYWKIINWRDCLYGSIQ